jgi:hypothetical protein
LSPDAHDAVVFTTNDGVKANQIGSKTLCGCIHD